MTRKLPNLAFCLVMGTLFSFALSLAVMESTLFEVNWQPLLGWCLFGAAAWCLLLFNRYTSIVTAVLLAAFAALMILTAWRGEAVFDWDWLGNFQNTIRELYWFVIEPDAEQLDFVPLLTMTVCLMVTTVAMLNIRLHFNFALLVVMGVSTLCIPTLSGYGTSFLAEAVFAFCLLVFLLKKSNYLGQSKVEGAERSSTTAALRAVPLCLVIMGIAALLPDPGKIEQPVSPEEFLDRIHAMASRIRSTGFSSFSDSRRLGGPIELGEDLVMEVQSPERLYLAGSYKDTYTGSGWTQSRDSRTSTRLEALWVGTYDTSPYSPSMKELQQYYMRFYGREEQQVIISTANRTTTIFSPPSTTRLQVDIDPGMWQDSYGAVTVNRNLTRGAAYRQDYISWNWNGPYFINMLQALEARSDSSDMAQYLTLPDSLPSRIPQLAQQITADYYADYDKLRAITSYLARFPYTLQPDNVPADEDFVDYFLFTGQEGYCVYYASSLAVMARSIGIPTRYVEGYVMPQEHQDGIYTVTTAQGHAWVEAWFEGFGWVPFEATAPYYSGLYGQEVPSDESPDEEISDEGPEDNLSDVDGPEPADEPQEPDLPDLQRPPATDSDTGNNDDSEESPPSGGILFPAILFLLVAVVAASVILVGRIKRRRFSAMDQRESVLVLFPALVNVLRIYGCPKQREETVHAYLRRAQEFLDNAGDLASIADIVCRASFSQEEISSEDRTQVWQTYLRLVGKLTSHVRYWPGLLFHLCTHYPY